jgi:hypothetical protein
MHLTPDEMIYLARRVFQTQRHHCIHMGGDVRSSHRFKARYA